SQVCFFANNAGDAHPMTTGRYLFQTNAHVSLELNSKRIAIPKISNEFLLFGEAVPIIINFFREFIKTGRWICIKRNRGSCTELFYRIKKEGPNGFPVRLDSSHVFRWRRFPCTICFEWLVTGQGTEFEIAIGFAPLNDLF